MELSLALLPAAQELFGAGKQASYAHHLAPVASAGSIANGVSTIPFTTGHKLLVSSSLRNVRFAHFHMSEAIPCTRRVPHFGESSVFGVFLV